MWRPRISGPGAVLRLGLISAAAWLAAGPARADLVYGVSDNTQKLVTLDSNNGQVTSSINVTGTGGGFEDITPDINQPGQLLLSAHGTGAIGSHTLFRLDPTTGAATTIGDITNGAGLEYWVEGMAYVQGMLYGSASRIDISSGTPKYLSYAPDTSDTLIRIDPATGHATQVGMFGPQFLNMEDIAWSPKYGLIGADIGTLDPATNFSTFHTTPALVRIDPATGVATKIADLPHDGLISNPFNNILSPSGPFVAGLDFTPDGNTLFGATIQTHFGGTNSGFVQVNPTTGALTTISTVDLPVFDGITFQTITVPEPTSRALLALRGLGIVAACRVRARGRRAGVSPAGAD